MISESASSLKRIACRPERGTLLTWLQKILLTVKNLLRDVLCLCTHGESMSTPAKIPPRKIPLRKERPRPFVIDLGELDKLCGFQCTQDEICSFFDVDVTTFATALKKQTGKGFNDYFREKRDIGKISLRRAQFASALGGNPALLIYLGKTVLGQVEKTVHEVQHTGNVPSAPVHVMVKLNDDAPPATAAMSDDQSQ